MMDEVGSSVLSPNRVQVAIALTVAASGGLVATWGGAPPWIALTAVFGGLIVGIALTAYLSWIAPESGRPDRRERP